MVNENKNIGKNEQISTDGCLVGWMDGWIDEWINRYMDRRMDG